MTRWIAPPLLVGLLACTPPGNADAQAQWQDIATLGAGDAALAAAVAAPMWGDDPTQWPDWLDVKAVRLPTGHGKTIVVVRVPWHAPCGQYGMTILGPVTSDQTRIRSAVDFCAGELTVIPVDHQDMPDLRFREGRVLDPVSGRWNREDIRIRWVDDRWMLVNLP